MSERTPAVRAPARSDVVDLFLELAAIESPPGREREVADVVLGYLRDLALDPHEDEAGAAIGSEIGNIYCRIAPTVEGGTPIFLNAHLDTVPPTGPIEPVIEDGRVTNRHPTILGADNKAAVAAMLAAVGDVLRENAPHAGIELVLTPMEEVGLRGAKRFDCSRLHARFGFCYDHAAPIGNIVLAAPTQKTLRLVFGGRPAHSGIEPEKGRSAILAAARAISAMPLGRLDEHTTANVGLISGGVARNIVPPECEVWAEARSHDRARLAETVRDILSAGNEAANAVACTLEAQVTGEYESYRLSQDDPPVVLAAAALRGAGYEPSFIESGGGADANVFNAAGTPCVNLCNGMAEIHTADEWIAVDDLEGMRTVTRCLIDLARIPV